MLKINQSPPELSKTEYFYYEGLKLSKGQLFGPVTVAYQTYGKLNPQRNNALLICHALTGDAHVAGISAEDGRSGWWDRLVGAGKPLDTNKYFIICSNVLGGCKGTSGPSSINPFTGQPYALSFPVITIEDMVRVQSRLIKSLSIEKLLAVVGGSMGGMQALAWAKLYPERVRAVIALATCASVSAQGIALNEAGRRAIMADANWQEGNYYGSTPPAKGLAVARMIGHISYLSARAMTRKFDRRLQFSDKYNYSLGVEFEVENYLKHQGEVFNARFDANSYLYLTRAIDYFDFTDGNDDLRAAFAKTKARYLFISYSSDWLYPPHASIMMVNAARDCGLEVEYLAAKTEMGHDAFLIETAQQGSTISRFLEKGFRQESMPTS